MRALLIFLLIKVNFFSRADNRCSCEREKLKLKRLVHSAEEKLRASNHNKNRNYDTFYLLNTITLIQETLPLIANDCSKYQIYITKVEVLLNQYESKYINPKQEGDKNED